MRSKILIKFSTVKIYSHSNYSFKIAMAGLTLVYYGFWRLSHRAPLATLSLPLYAAKCAFGLLEEYLLFVRLIGFDKSTTLSPTIDRANLFSTRDFFPRNSEKRNRVCDSIQATLIPVLDEKKSTSILHW